MHKADMIYNPNAGRFPSRILAERAANVLRSYDWDIRIIKTENPDQATRIARKTAEAGKEALFVVGGDGTVSMAVRGLAGSATALGVLPGGTANVLAQELGLPGLRWTRWMALEESARRLAVAAVREVDIGMCGATPFVMWAGVGLDAFAIHHIEPRPRAEKIFANMTYVASSAWHASVWHGINLNINVDHLHISGHYLLALMSNIHLYAGGLINISPNARLDDGLFDLLLFEGDTLADTLQVAWGAYTGRHTDMEKVHCIPFRHLELESDTPLFVQVDAEPVPCNERSIEINVIPKGIRILVPNESPRELFISENSMVKERNL